MIEKRIKQKISDQTHFSPTEEKNHLPSMLTSEQARLLRNGNHCSCSPNCISQFAEQDIMNRRAEMEACKTREKKTQFLASQCLENESTLLPHQNFQYRFNGINICRPAFCDIHGISLHKLDSVHKTVHEMGKKKFELLLEQNRNAPHVRPTQQSNNHHRTSFEQVCLWFVDWLNKRVSYHDESKQAYLIEDFHWEHVYTNEFIPEWKQKHLGVSPPSMRTFKRAKDEVFTNQSVVFLRPQDHPFCTKCVEFQHKLKHDSVLICISRFHFFFIFNSRFHIVECFGVEGERESLVFGQR